VGTGHQYRQARYSRGLSSLPLSFVFFLISFTVSSLSTERTSFELTQDTAWVVVLATSPGVLTLHTGSTVQTYNVTAGANKLAQALSPGDTLQATLTRDDETVLDLTPNFTFQGATDTHNYNAFVSYVKTNTSAPSS
jgi:hypothetical protein